MDYEEYLHMLDFKEECEMYYWYGQKTYDSNGQTYMKDENGTVGDFIDCENRSGTRYSSNS